MSFLNNMIRHRSARISDRYTEVWKELADNYKPQRILSYGCGLGEECFSLTKHFPTAQIKGVDIQSKTIERAISKNKFDNVSFEIANYQSLLNDEHYDMIFAMNVFKIIKISEKELNERYPLHVFDAQIIDLIQLLKKDGLFVIDGSSYSIEQTSSYQKSLVDISCDTNTLWIKNKGKNCVFKKV
jgi:predicted TPR repeat methyltransferase